MSNQATATIRLPDTWYGIIRHANADARSIDRYFYYPDARQWHKYHRDTGCAVCHSGAVIAGSMQFPRRSTISHLNEERAVIPEIGKLLFLDDATNDTLTM